MSRTETFDIHWTAQRRGRLSLREGKAGPAATPPTADVPARVARLVALAHRIDGLVRSGAVRDYAQVAALAGLTRARVSQITDLLALAPDLQERLLEVRKPALGREGLGERDLRAVVRELDWKKQRVKFAAVTQERGSPTRSV